MVPRRDILKAAIFDAIAASLAEGRRFAPDPTGVKAIRNIVNIALGTRCVACGRPLVLDGLGAYQHVEFGPDGAPKVTGGLAHAPTPDLEASGLIFVTHTGKKALPTYDASTLFHNLGWANLLDILDMTAPPADAARHGGLGRFLAFGKAKEATS